MEINQTILYNLYGYQPLTLLQSLYIYDLWLGLCCANATTCTIKNMQLKY